MTIYFTGVGDHGKTRLGKKMINKDHKLFDLLGTFDELNCWLGICRLQATKSRGNKEMPVLLMALQQLVFKAQAQIVAPFIGLKAEIGINGDDIIKIENAIHKINKVVPPLKKFVIPGAGELSAQLDLARTVARRAERSLVSFGRKNKIKTELTIFVNRLSSLLFAMARLAEFKSGINPENPKY